MQRDEGLETLEIAFPAPLWLCPSCLMRLKLNNNIERRETESAGSGSPAPKTASVVGMILALGHSDCTFVSATSMRNSSSMDTDDYLQLTVRVATQDGV